MAHTLNLNRNRSILICTKECLEIDLNILNNKSMNKNFKMIVKGNIDSLKQWIKANNINIIDCKNLEQEIKNLYEFGNGPVILNIKEEI